MKKYVLSLIFCIIIILFSSCKQKTVNVTYINGDLEVTVSYSKNSNVKLDVLDDYTTTSNSSIITNESGVCLKNSLQVDEYHFVGWQQDDGSVIANIFEITEDIKLKAYYIVESKEAAIKYYFRTDEIDNLDEFKEEIIYSETYKIINPTNEGYIFAGWYLDSKLTKKAQSTIEIDSYEIYSLYAKWLVDKDYIINKQKKEAQVVIDLIDELEENVTIDNINKINEVNEIYNSLDKAVKNYVTNYDKLKRLVEKAKELSEVQNLLNDYQNINKNITASTPQDYELIKLVYNKLSSFSDELKAQINNIEEILSLYDAYVDEYKQYEEKAFAFDYEIARFPSYTYVYQNNNLKKLYDEYNNMDEKTKYYVACIGKVETLIKKADSNKDLIIYSDDKNKEVFKSKEELYEFFFTDFYYFIKHQYGNQPFIDANINSLQDFLKLGLDYYGTSSPLYGLGNAFGNYFLEKDPNGVIENQSKDYFFGFCYQNDMYKGLIEFFTTYFAYFRLDEKYANTSNRGADIYAESWAPTVDICKFFYFDEETLPAYQKTPRLLDCFINVYGVVYERNNTLYRRGYIFEGYYYDENYNEVADINNIDRNRKVYLKWKRDNEAIDLDKAAFVDVYIYNLSTEKAIVNDKTIGYIEHLYEKLSEKAKEYVKNYDAFVNIKSKYF